MLNKKILLIVGSLRKNSFNKQLAIFIQEFLNQYVSTEILDYKELPLFNQDIEFPTPQIVKEIREKFALADVIWFFTPEYNGHVSGVLKNLLDWLSRPISQNEFGIPNTTFNKPITMSGAAGKMKSIGSIKNLKEISSAMKMIPIDIDEVGIALSPESFQTNKLNLTNDDKNRLLNQAKALLSYINNLVKYD